MKQIRNPWMVPGHGPFFGDDSFPSDAVKKDFELRQRVLLANLSNPAFFSPGILDMSTPGNHEVPLHEFAAWCVDTMIHWGIPQELAALAKGVPQAAPVVTVKAVQVTSPSNNAWEDRAREIADKVALKKWDSGIREITARNICDAVATELAKETKNHGNRGPRSSGSVRSKGLKGWKFILPAGTNGTSGTKE